MQFNSYEFLVFLPLVACLHFMLPHRFRWLLLLLASYLFYMAWVPSYVVLILVSTIVDYAAARLMSGSDVVWKRRVFLTVSLVINLGLLLTFKYFDFIGDSLQGLFLALGVRCVFPDSDLLLPIGISFYTFQTLSYTIEVYRRRQPCEKHLGVFAVYVAFFPQLVAGPIERPQNLLGQFYERHRVDADRIISGLRLILWGMFKKVVVADRLATMVDPIYSNPSEFAGPALAVATVFFAFQIYCDFSGYSDIAIGAARLFGFRLMRNFRRPYQARSIGEFWHRWHISLSTWFRDYLYIPMGGNRVTIKRWHVNLLITFVLSGLWHGANWTFLVWGGLHGLLYLLSAGLRRPYSALRGALRLSRIPLIVHGAECFVTFIAVCVAWVFFRAKSLSEAVYVLGAVARDAPELFSLRWLTDLPPALGVSELVMWGAVGLIGIVQLVEHFQGDGGPDVGFERMPRPVRWLAYLVLGLAVLNLGVAEEVPFIYFQF